MIIADASEARTIDEKAMAEWGLPSAVLVEAAGRECAQALIAQWHRVVPNHTHYTAQSPRLVLAAGSGNNGADGMVLLKTLILKGLCDVPHCVIVLSKPESELQVSPAAPSTPRSQAFQVLKKMGIPVLVWQEMAQTDRGALFSKADLIIDALTGTGLSGPLKGPVAELVFAINQSRRENPNQRVISLDVPSGLSDSWDPPDPLVTADITLAIEPIKACLFKPAARPKAGHILPVTGIFPDILLAQGPKNRLVTLAALSSDRDAVDDLRVKAESYKHQRGVVQIFAGAPGTSGAAILAGRGAQAAGAGLIQIVTEPVVAEHLMAQAGGLLLTCQAWLDEQKESGIRPALNPDAVVMGPGLSWNRTLDDSLTKAMEDQAQRGIGLVFDADAIVHAAVHTFMGPTVFTPHPVEFERLLKALPLDTTEGLLPGGDKLSRLITNNPVPLLQLAARKTNAVIVLKGHVIFIGAPDGSYSVIDGMESSLAMGGSGDLLAGLTGALMARMKRKKENIDPLVCSQWAVAILIEAGHRLAQKGAFQDPLALVEILGSIAGELWLPPLRGTLDGR